jgi:hypothetical protein
MMRVWKIALCLAGGLALNAGLHADNVAFPDNPYAAIVVRNVFGLNPPPPPVDPNAPPPEPEVKITANGIMAIMGQAEALYKTTVAGKPDQSYMLAEGQREDDIEVVKIDEKARSVTFNNHGVVQEIPLANTTDSGKGGSSAQRGPIFGSVPGIPLPAFPTAGGANGASAFPPPAGFGGPNNSSSGANFGGGPNSGANNGTSMPFGSTTQNNTATQPQNTMDPDVQQVLIVANHLKAIQDGDPTAAIFPVTDADSLAGVPSNLSSNQPPADPTPPVSP